MEVISLYKNILRIRMVEEAIANRYSEQKMRCPTHLSIGQEAVAVGVSASLINTDRVYSSHRAHAHYLAKGGSLKRLIAELYGKETGCTGGRGGSMHLSDLDAGFVASTAIVANSIPLAVGNGLHQKLHSDNAISVTYFGDGATEEGAFYESLNFAIVKCLPVLFVCENNFYSVYSGLECRQPKGRSIANLVSGFGCESSVHDGNDVLQVFKSANQAIERIRSGKGPVFLEYSTYRHREHCGPSNDDDLNYRDPIEVSKWLNRDPILVAEETLINEGFTIEQNYSIKKQIQIEIDEAFAFAESSAFPNPVDNERFIYAE